MFSGTSELAEGFHWYCYSLNFSAKRVTEKNGITYNNELTYFKPQVTITVVPSKKSILKTALKTVPGQFAVSKMRVIIMRIVSEEKKKV